MSEGKYCKSEEEKAVWEEHQRAHRHFENRSYATMIVLAVLGLVLLALRTRIISFLGLGWK